MSAPHRLRTRPAHGRGRYASVVMAGALALSAALVAPSGAAAAAAPVGPVPSPDVAASDAPVPASSPASSPTSSPAADPAADPATAPIGAPVTALPTLAPTGAATPTGGAAPSAPPATEPTASPPATTAAPALAATPKPTAATATRAGLYGTQDPTYDGVYRQSLALLALHSAKRAPAPAAVTWLLGQQCADGGWTAYRVDVTKPCLPSEQDTNATGMAVQALAALGRREPAVDGAAWLTRRQRADGGVGFTPGGATDANSTALFAQALVAVGTDPATVATRGATPYAALLGLQVGCAGAAAERGAFDYQPKDATRIANDYATVQAALALTGTALPVAPRAGGDDQPSPTCPEAAPPTPAQAAALGAGYLARTLTAGKGSIASAFGDGPDFGSTASAVLVLVATGTGAPAARLAGDVLRADGPAWAGTQPAALSLLALASHALGSDDPALLRAVEATLTPAGTPTPSPSPTRTPDATPSTTTPTPTATTTTTAAPSGGRFDDTDDMDDTDDTDDTDDSAATDDGAGAAPGGLASTGSEGVLPLAGVGVLLLVAGAVVVRRTRGVRTEGRH